MKKIASNLFLLSGILCLFSAIKSEDMSTWLTLGPANIELGIVFRKKYLQKRIVKKILQTMNLNLTSSLCFAG